jgi:hypothetical protein
VLHIEAFLPSLEKEFLDINLTKDLSLFLHAIHAVPSTGGFKENQTVKSLEKKSAKQENSSLFMKIAF